MHLDAREGVRGSCEGIMRDTWGHEKASISISWGAVLHIRMGGTGRCMPSVAPPLPRHKSHYPCERAIVVAEHDLVLWKAWSSGHHLLPMLLTWCSYSMVHVPCAMLHVPSGSQTPDKS